MNKGPVRTLFFAALLLAAGCSEQPEKPSSAQLPRQEAPLAPPGETADEVERLLAPAASSEGAPANEARLDAAAELVRRGDLARAAALLDELEGASLASAQWVRHSLLRARLELEAGAAAAALARLDNPALQAEGAAAGRALQVELALTRADALAALGRHLDSARERVRVQPLLGDETARHDNTRAILAALAGADMAALEHETGVAASDDWRGWLELAALVRDLRRGPGEQLAALARWEQRYALIAPLQPALRDILPAVRERIRQPTRVALLLPLEGRAASGATAVLNGYLAEHMRQLAAGEQPPPVAVVDTTAAPGGFAGAYAAAVADGASMVIGPLLKEDLAAFGPALQPSVTTLALNFDDRADSSAAGLYAFGLDAADEVAQLAAAARTRGFAHAIVVADDSDAAHRQAKEFERLWNRDGTRVLDTLYLADINEFRRRFEQALLFEQSRQRGVALSRLLGMDLVAEPRRRQDLDLIVMLADPVAARSIRPLLSFLYAGDLPVWSTSQASAARPDQRNDRDLEDVRFLDLPWFSGAERPLRETLRRSVPAGGLQRLAALGADACRLQSRLGLFDWMHDAGLSGATGELVADGSQRLHRRSQWYVFGNGLAAPEQQRAAMLAASLSSQSTEGETPWTEPRAAPLPPPDAPPKTGP